ncbi:MAG TPA: NAD(P)H-binding protein [Anaerolineales bacterium]|nr:NAD(P)H-binding protein [Anaerolineales bacterium]
MILVTGGTGFVGKALVRNLVEAGHTVRTLIRPSSRSPNLPRGVAVEVAVCSLDDLRGLRAAMVGVDTVYHLAGVERRGAYASLMNVDILGTRAVAQAAVDARVDRIFYLSHLGADRASAFPVLKAKAIAEEFIRRSKLDYTILRTAVVYGPDDSFTTGLARIIGTLPYFFFVPGNGRTQLQPLWVEDLVTCLTWALDDNDTRNEMYEVGGPEFFTFTQILEMIMETLDIRRRLVYLKPPYLRGVTVAFEALFPGLPVSVYWLDYLAANRICALDTVPRVFNLMPARISQRLEHLRNYNWRRAMLRTLIRRRG